MYRFVDPVHLLCRNIRKKPSRSTDMTGGTSFLHERKNQVKEISSIFFSSSSVNGAASIKLSVKVMGLQER